MPSLIRQTYNRTNFTSATVAAKILDGMRSVLETGLAAYITNKKGERYLRIQIVQNFGCAGGYAWQFLAGSSQDVSGPIADAAWFSWDLSAAVDYECLQFVVAKLTEHPRRTFEEAERVRIEAQRQRINAEITARKERVERLECNVRLHAVMKGRGATHIIRTDAGKYLFASFRKTWLGLGLTVIRVYNATPEVEWKRNKGGKMVARQVHDYELSREAALCVTITGVLK